MNILIFEFVCWCFASFILGAVCGAYVYMEAERLRQQQREEDFDED